MRLICPHCMSGVTVSDDAAGKEATCPNCGKSFPTPPRYSASVVPEAAAGVASTSASTSAPPAPPGLVPPPAPAATDTGFLPPESRTAETPTPAGYTHSSGFTISPNVIGWLPVVFLTLALVFTFFPWVGTFIGGSAVYSQGPWRAVSGNPQINRGLEAVAPPGTTGEWVGQVSSDWLLMLPFLLFLILAVVLAIADRVLQSQDPARLPPPVQKAWPHRHTLIAALSLAAVILVVIQSLSGFGLERMIYKLVRENPVIAEERAKAGADQYKLDVVKEKEKRELERYNLERTTWMHLSILFLALGALSTIGYMALARRGDKPPPKLMLHY